MASIEETAFAKINLDLRVCSRRADGYHDLDSLVVFAEPGDRLTLEPADHFAFVIDGPFKTGLPNGDGNLVVRAAKDLAALIGRKPDVRVTLEKRLPVASGLGGGSADAAATLRGLVRLWNLTLSLADLVPLARRLGADVPVCLGSTAARMEGIGDRLTPISLPAHPAMLLVNPGKAVATPDVFRRLRDHSGARDPSSFCVSDPIFRAHLEGSVNDLEAPAIGIAPVIGAVLAAVRDQPGCALARMSGSGATCFGLFDDVAERDRAVSALSIARPRWWVASADGR